MNPKGRTREPKNRTGLVQDYYRTLRKTWGPQHWWPAETPIEVIVGAYLTQNTTWSNVEKALNNLRRKGLLEVAAIRTIGVSELEELIRPAGYFRQKSRALKAFVGFLDAEYRGSLEEMFAQPTEQLRNELLGLKGVGPETADSILLYAGQHPAFVVDAYTRRVVERHGILRPLGRYEEIRTLFEAELSGILDEDSAAGLGSGGAAHSPSAMSLAKRSTQVQVFNEMHALLVGIGKNYCRKTEPLCHDCPLKQYLPNGK